MHMTDEKKNIIIDLIFLKKGKQRKVLPSCDYFKRNFSITIFKKFSKFHFILRKQILSIPTEFKALEKDF